MEAKTYENILVSREARVGIVTLNRPKALNALSPDLLAELVEALDAFDRDETIGAMVIAGSERAFAAGADIKAMAEASMVDMTQSAFLPVWDRVAQMTKPVIAAVSGFALGGGAELMMMCDMVVASETTKIGLPEVSLGVIPGAGGTQRLTRTLGKVLTMEMILTGRQLDAQEALSRGLVNRVVPVELFLEEALKLASDVAGRAPVAVRMGKECVNKALDTFLSQGLAHERQTFCMLFGTEDQKEGMRAFVEKRPATWKGK